MKLSWLCTFLLLIRTPALFAEEHDSEPVLADVTVRFFPVHRRPIEGLYIQTKGGEFLPIKFRSRMRSRGYKYMGPEKIPLYRRVFDEELQEVIYDVVLHIMTPTHKGDVLVLMMPPGQIKNPVYKDDWLIIPIDDTPSVFKPNSIRVLNATGFHLQGGVDQDNVSLDLGLSEPFPLPSGNNFIHLGFAIQVPDGLELVYGNRLQVSPAARIIIVLRPPRRKRSIKIDTYLLQDYPKLDPSDESELDDNSSSEK